MWFLSPTKLGVIVKLVYNETEEFVQSYCKKNKHPECGEFGWDVFTRILAGPGNEFPNKKTGCNCQAGNENEEFVQAL